MKFISAGLVIVVFLLSGRLKAEDNPTDTGKIKSGFHLMVSAKPVVNWLGGNKDSNEHFFYSKVQFEVQYNFKRHTLGLGLNGGYNMYTTLVNSVPYHTKSNMYFFSPSYSYLLHAEKRWKYYLGASYLYGYKSTINTIQTPIETITKSSITYEEGSSIFLRINYRFRHHFSIELETAFFFTKIRNEYLEDYPLTPSLNNSKPVHHDAYTYAVPSNLFIKYSF